MRPAPLPSAHLVARVQSSPSYHAAWPYLGAPASGMSQKLTSTRGTYFLPYVAALDLGLPHAHGPASTCFGLPTSVDARRSSLSSSPRGRSRRRLSPCPGPSGRRSVLMRACTAGRARRCFRPCARPPTRAGSAAATLAILYGLALAGFHPRPLSPADPGCSRESASVRLSLSSCSDGCLPAHRQSITHAPPPVQPDIPVTAELAGSCRHLPARHRQVHQSRTRLAQH